MIYLDSAATSYRKPPCVHRAAADALRRLSSPGRGGYASAMAASEVLLDAREALAAMFHLSAPERIIFTSSATHALNIAIKSLVNAGDPVVISGYEHNAVLRPLHAIGAEVRIAASPLFHPEEAAEAFRQRLPGAKAVVCNHVSNVFGYILPIEKIASLCRDAGVPLVVDASQSAGVLPLDIGGLGCAFAALPGHKGLMGPQGTGVLLCGEAEARPLLEGGTGSDSADAAMPAYLPDRLEPGTHNMPGIAGLLAGTRWLAAHGPASILAHERRLCRLLAASLQDIPGIQLFAAEDESCQTGVLSVRIEGLDGEEAARLLAERGIAVRAGLHCAPLAHKTAGTFDTGTVRLSFSPFSTEGETLRAAKALIHLAKYRHNK